MLENMFVGNPPGNYDRLLDFSHPATGSLFFVPTSTFLDNVSVGGTSAAGSAETPLAAPASSVAEQNTSLRIGSLKGEKNE
jgi:putative iron-dependent peroxidase